MNFPPIYIIKIPGSERNPDLFKSLERLGLDYEIQNAIVGSELTPSEITERVNLKACKARLGYDISFGLIGCALSHNQIYRMALKKNFDWILVFEEDAILIDFNPNQILEIIESNDALPTIVQLFSRSARLMNVKNKIKLSDGIREIYNFKPRLVGSGASAYLINKSAMKESQTKNLLCGPPDWPEWSVKVQMKGVYPWMTSESHIDSTIPEIKISRSRHLVRKITQVTFLHYFYYKSEYAGIKSYIAEEINPTLWHLIWRLRGARFYKNDVNGPQVIGKN